MYARCEGDGTLYLDDDIRSRYGDVFIVLETDDGILLVPAEEDTEKDAKRVVRFSEKYYLENERVQKENRTRERG